MAGPLLPDAVLALCRTLPRSPKPVRLIGPSVELRPLDLDRDVPTLHAVSCGAPITLGGRRTPAYDPDEQIWRYMSGGPFQSPDELRDWLAASGGAPDALALAVRAHGDLVGVACLMANNPAHLKVELGGIWYSPAARGRGVSAMATHLMLGHVFGLGYRRVEWKCDVDNQASRRSALAYGFTFEGVQQAHYIVKGHTRDTAWFRMLGHEWPTASAPLLAYAQAQSQQGAVGRTAD